MNYLHSFHLVEAEKARVLGQFLEAEELYEHAIASAAEHECIQDEALAYELAAKHYLARGREKFAQTYLKEAHDCYERWGATEKVKELETRYPQFFTQKAASQSTDEHASDHSEIATLAQQVAELTAALHRSEAKFRAIFENSQIGIFRVGISDGLILNANQRFANLYGFDSPEEMIGLERTTSYYVNPSDRQQFLELLKREGEVRSYEAHLRKRDGTVFWGLFSSYLNVADGYIEGVIADISIAKHLEEGRKQSEAALQTSEERLRLALTAANQGLYDLNIKTEEIVVNPEYALMRGYDPATFHETKSSWIESLHPDDRESVVAACNACIAGDLPNYRAEFRHRTQDGQWKWIRSVGKVVAWNESGEPIRALGVYTDIDDRKQAEAALQASESKLRSLIEAIPDPLFVLTAEGKFLEIIVQEPTLLWQPIEEMMGKTIHQLGKEQADEFLGYIQQVLRTQQILTVEYSACLNGREAWFSARIAPIDHNQVIWLSRDITHRKQAEEALQRSEAKFRTIFENSQVGIYRTRTCDGLILNANQRFADLFGFDSPQGMIGIEHTLGYWVNPSDRQQGIELMKRDGEVRNFEVQMRKRDGTVFWGLFSSYLNAGDDYIEGVLADISDRKQAEAALQASEAELRALFSAIPDLMCIFNAEGQVICVTEGNPSYKELYKEELVGKTLHQLFAKEQADEFLGCIQQVLSTQQVLTVEYRQWLSEREIWFSARIAPIDHEQVIWLARDIMLQKQAEAASIVEERNRMAREIHDTLAQAFTGILAQVGAVNQVLADDLEATQAHLDLIKELARTGLTEARRSVVALRPQLLEEGSLQSALHRLVTQIRAAANDTTLYYEVKGTAYVLPPEVESNLLRIGQEALTNAIRHANADEIRVELIYESERFLLCVKDDGQGFGVGSIPSSDGFGLLGMSERAERINAQLTISSQPEQGTEIVVVVGV
jgi:PAS domain S-box-containing protein